MLDTRGAFDVRRQMMVAVQPFVGQFALVRSVWTRVWLVLLAFAIGSRGMAAATGIDFDNTLGAIPDSICNAATFLQGPVGFGVVAVIFIIGLIRLLSGNRGGLGFIITAFAVGLVLVAAPELLKVFTDGEACIAGA